MFVLICGEDVVQARNYLQKTKEDFRSKHTQVYEVTASELEQTLRSDQTQTLFGEPIVLYTSGLLAYWSRAKKKTAEQIKALQDNPDHTIINWEEGKSLYELKLKANSTVKEFKLSASIFDLQDKCAPGNKESFISLLRKLAATQEPFLLFSVLRKHIRLLLLLKTNQPTGAINPYIKSKASLIAKKWELKKLAQFYLGLARIDQSTKSSSTPYSLVDSIEILACYYL